VNYFYVFCSWVHHFWFLNIAAVGLVFIGHPYMRATLPFFLPPFSSVLVWRIPIGTEHGSAE
jgi:hypothetical protein